MRKPQSDIIMDDWLAVSTDGFASMNAGRDPAHLVKELVQNSLDAVGDKLGAVPPGHDGASARRVRCHHLSG